jgi:tetratricopeptide (TPR) repeat protein
MTADVDLFQQALNSGHSAAWDGMWDKAADYYRQALQVTPDQPRALSSLALALYEQGQYDSALQTYLHAARITPGQPALLEKIAQLYERLGSVDWAAAAALQAAELYVKNHELDRAIENWNRVLRLKPESLQARSRLALVFEKTGRSREAVSEYVTIASLFQSAGEIEKAYRTLQHALQIFPNNNEALQALDLLKSGRQLPRAARPSGGSAPLRMARVRSMDTPAEPAPIQELDPVAEARRRALTILAGLLFDIPEELPAEPAPRRGLGVLVRDAGSRLAKGAGAGVQDRARIFLHLSQVVDLQTQGQPAQAIEELERAVEAGLDHPAAHFDLGLLYAENGRLDEALHSLGTAVKHPDFNLGGRLLLGKVLGQLGRWKEAAIEYLEALSLVDAAVVLTDQAEDLRMLYEPIIETQRGLPAGEDHRALCENIAALLVRPAWREALAEARQQLPITAAGGVPIPFAEILTQSRSNEVVESLSRINRLASSGYLRSAMEEAFYALQHAPTYLPLHVYMGELLLKQDRLPEAVSKLLMAAQTYAIRGETRRAIDLYHRVIALAPMDLNARSRLLELLVGLGWTEEALNETLALAEVYYDQADLDLARKTLAEALQLAQGPRIDRTWRARILYRMADIDLQRLEWRQALRLYEQIRNLQPDEEKARLKLVELNFRLGQESQALTELDHYLAYLVTAGQAGKAAAFLEGLIRENIDQPQVRRRLGEVYAQLGRSEEAVTQLDAAGEAFLQAGERAGAATTIEAILALNPPNAAEYRSLLGQLKSKPA